MTEATLDALPLPELRPELELLRGYPDLFGRPTWLIHDPAGNRFTQINAGAYVALKHWRECSTFGELAERASDSGTMTDCQAVAALVDFLFANQLTVAPRAGGWQSFSRQQAARRHSPLGWLMHNYLFFRLPLVRPQPLLEATLPFARIVWSAPARYGVLAMGLIGLYLASRQWQLFISTLQSSFTWEGAIVSALALAFIKTAHELGHAYTAVNYGCRVHTMGVAFVVMAPLPYTDVTDTWRLADRRKRLAIDGAGIVTETAIAAVALCLWSFLPDGPARSAAFVFSAVGIVSSLAINLNPFMRFDGYYLLTELLQVENLQTRAFALGRWQLRELLFGLRAPCPDELPGGRVAILIVYAWAVWLYRVTLFVGIALLVYHYFFKALGVILFAVEIGFFVLRPIVGELFLWWKMRKALFATGRTVAALALALAAIVGFVIPWSTQIEIPTVLETEQLQSVHPIRAARITAVLVKQGDRVHKGATLVTFDASDIEDELRRSRIELEIAMLQYGRRISDAVDKEGSLVLQSRIDSLTAKIAGLEQERSDLKAIAPFDGKVVDFNSDVQPGRWIAPNEQIAVISGGARLVARGYVAESDVGRLSLGASATFIPEHPSRPRIAMHIAGIGTAGVSAIDLADLASIHGGRVAVAPDDHRRLVPASAQYYVELAATQPGADSDLSVRGVAIAMGKPESLLARAWQRALSVLLRESGA